MADKTVAGKDDDTDWSGVISTVGAVTLVTALVMTLGFATVFGLAGSKLANRTVEAPASTTSLGTAPAGYAAAVPAAPAGPSDPALPADPGVALPVDPAVPAPAPAAELPPALAELPPALEAAPLAAPEPAAPESPAAPATPDAAAPPTAAPERSAPAGFMVTDANPTATRLGEIIHFLVATDAPDAEKARNLEGGQRAVVVPKTVYNLGCSARRAVQTPSPASSPAAATSSSPDCRRSRRADRPSTRTSSSNGSAATGGCRTTRSVAE